MEQRNEELTRENRELVQQQQTQHEISMFMVDDIMSNDSNISSISEERAGETSADDTVLIERSEWLKVRYKYKKNRDAFYVSKRNWLPRRCKAVYDVLQTDMTEPQVENEADICYKCREVAYPKGASSLSWLRHDAQYCKNSRAAD